MTLPTLRIIDINIGIILITLAEAKIVPMATQVIYDRFEDLREFLWASAITFIAGLALVVPGRPDNLQLRPRHM
ncbi:potassium transporter TrkH, partial [Pseudomonas syringae pv. tagetis]